MHLNYNKILYKVFIIQQNYLIKVFLIKTIRFKEGELID